LTQNFRACFQNDRDAVFEDTRWRFGGGWLKIFLKRGQILPINQRQDQVTGLQWRKTSQVFQTKT